MLSADYCRQLNRVWVVSMNDLRRLRELTSGGAIQRVGCVLRQQTINNSQPDTRAAPSCKSRTRTTLITRRSTRSTSPDHASGGESKGLTFPDTEAPRAVSMGHSALVCEHEVSARGESTLRPMLSPTLRS